MSGELGDWGRLLAVAMPAGALISLMLYVKSVAAGQSPRQTWGVIATLWAALLGTICAVIVLSTAAGGPLIEVDTLTGTIRLHTTGGFRTLGAIVSLVLTVGLWSLAVWRMSKIPPPQQEPPAEYGEQDDCNNGID